MKAMKERTIRLEFADFVDLQTRLVLLPRVADQGTGAVVAAHKTYESISGQEERETAGKENVHRSDANGPTNEDTNGKPAAEVAEIAAGIQEDTGTLDESVDAIDAVQMEEKKEDHDETVNSTAASAETERVDKIVKNDDVAADSEGSDEEECSVVGLILSGVASVESDEDWRNKDFTEILATIREATTPIVLLLERLDENTDEEPDDEATHNDLKQAKEEHPEDDASTASSATPEDADEPKVSQIMESPSRNLLGGRLSTWSSRAAILAAEAASGAASLSAAVKTAAAERAKASHVAEKRPSFSKQSDRKSPETTTCCLFVQTSSGSFLPLPEKSEAVTATSTATSSCEITTSSVLLIRRLDSQACPTEGYHFQWYRSCECPSERSVSDHSSKSSYSHDGESLSAITEWTILSGATYAAYQPNATDIGHRLRCEVTILIGNTSKVEDDLDDEIIVCETRNAVAADMSLFNGARQALLRGAQFGNLQGRGNAEGRAFRLLIEITRSADTERKSMGVTSAITIYQVSGNTAEPMHADPILCASAIADPSQPKMVDLVLPAGSSTMVSALSTDGRFQLQAPNRITRETLLLALGIANYKGKPADLDVRTVLYTGSPPERIRDIVPGAVVHTTPKASNQSNETEFYTPQESSSASKHVAEADSEVDDRAKALELELHAVRTMLSRKDKVVSDLQRQLTQSEKQRHKTETALSSCRSDLNHSRTECRETRTSLRKAEKRLETEHDTLQRLKRDHAEHASSLKNRLQSQSDKISSLEKSVRTLQNEKAVLSAAVEARDSKLSRMAEMQQVVDSLSEKVTRGDALRTELNDMSQRYAEITREMEKVSSFERECRDELQETRTKMDGLNDQLTKERQKTAGCQSELRSLQVKNQQLKAERNNYKQKADSLSKEVSRICRHGRSLRDVEKLIADADAMQEEVSLLKSQKRQALQDLHEYRTSYEQVMIAQDRAGVDGEALRALEQKAELERVVADMTEYVQAKEMQLETLKQVNQALSLELHELAQANMSKNEI